MFKIKVKSSSLKLNRRACQLTFMCENKLHLYCAGEEEIVVAWKFEFR